MSTRRAVGAGPALPTNDALPITEPRVRQALVTVAHIISTCGEVEYMPLLERLEAELARYREGRDPLARAKAILQAHAASTSAGAAHRSD